MNKKISQIFKDFNIASEEVERNIFKITVESEIDLDELQWQLEESTILAGNVHNEKIGEIYHRKGLPYYIALSCEKEFINLLDKYEELVYEQDKTVTYMQYKAPTDDIETVGTIFKEDEYYGR